MPQSPLIVGQVVGFVATSDVERSKAFYVETLGFDLVEDSPFALVLRVNGSMIRVQKVSTVEPPGYTVLGWDVPDISMTASALAKAGVSLLRVEGLPQDELGIWKTPDGTQVAWLKDPEGLILSLTQFPTLES